MDCSGNTWPRQAGNRPASDIHIVQLAWCNKLKPSAGIGLRCTFSDVSCYPPRD
eukprot:m.635500 g.635500  ORF g.635500 m.635500 type:complete len:54 (+) comp22585_c1_seq5:2864-3025(+)